MENVIYNGLGLIFVLLAYVTFGYEAVGLILLFLIYSELKYD
mgnify:CR=1 FL=1